MDVRKRTIIAVTVALTRLAAGSGAAIASDRGTQDERSTAPVDAEKPSSEQKQANAATRDAIFSNREQLLEYLRDPKSRSVICTPARNDSYELFQASIRDELDVLWDLDIYAVKYRLSKKQHQAVKTCAAEMERYLDNFQLWERLGH